MIYKSNKKESLLYTKYTYIQYFSSYEKSDFFQF